MNSFFSSARELVPLLEQLIGPGRQLGVRRDHAELLLVGEDLLAQLIPALVEQAFAADLLDPFRRRVVRGMRAAGHVVAEERLVRRDLVELLQPVMASSAMAVVRFQPGLPT